MKEAARGVLEPNGQPSTDPAHIQQVFPSTHPLWDPNADQGQEAVQWYRQLLFQGLRSNARLPTNLSKVSEVIQTKDESLTVFLE